MCDSKGKRIQGLLKKLQVDVSKLRKVYEIYGDDYIVSSQIEEDQIELRLPKEFKSLAEIPTGFKPIYKKVKHYATLRGIRNSDIIKYNIGYCDSGLYSGRIIIPSYDINNKLNYFIARSVFDDEPYKYKNPPVSKNVIMFENQINWNEPITICEGAFDALAVRRNAIPILGKFIPKKFDKEIEIDVTAPQIGVEIMSPPGMEEMTNQLQGMFQNLSGGNTTKKRKLKVKEALKDLVEEEAAKLINPEELKEKAIYAAENNGIVFIDEIDKVCARAETRGADVSREGVQRDLLPLIEGTTVSTKYGPVKTDHILFIASGAFHIAKPSDLLPELQGRLPIRVELQPLTEADFVRILTETDNALTRQYTALMGTEEVTVSFTEDGIAALARIAAEVNQSVENIGARRLYTVMERVFEELSFTAPDRSGQSATVNAAFVEDNLGALSRSVDVSRYVL